MEAVKAKAYWQLMRMDKPIGSLLLLWPTLWALFLAAQGLPKIPILIVFVLGVVLMRSAGCVINDFADRHFDGFVKRTHARPLPSGRLTSKEAIVLFGILVFASLVLVLTLNWLTIKLSVIALILAFSYPFMKRFTHMPQLILGMAFGWAIPMAYAAQSGELPKIAWILFAANVVWTIAYDTLYAMVDREDDVKIGIKSSAILFGRFDKLAVGLLQLLTILLLNWVGHLSQMPEIYYWAVLIAFALFIYQQWLIKDRDTANCFKAFLNNNVVGMVLFCGIGLSYTF